MPVGLNEMHPNLNSIQADDSLWRARQEKRAGSGAVAGGFSVAYPPNHDPHAI